MTDYIDLSLESNNKKIKVVDNGDGTYTLTTYDVNASSGVGGATNFIDLADVPSSYTGEAGSITVVNTAEDALEFLAPGTDGQILSISGTEPIWETPETLENGSEGQILTITDAEPAWATPDTLDNGTDGQVLTMSGTAPIWKTPTTLANGTENQVMTIVGGVPAWATHSTVDSTALHKATAGEIAALTEKTTPTGADIVVIEDSADSNNKKKLQLTNMTGTDSNAFHKATGSEISALTSKNTPIGADMLVIEDSEATNAKKKITLEKLIINPLEADGDLIYSGTDTTVVENTNSPSGDRHEFNDYNVEHIITDMDLTTSTAHGSISVYVKSTCQVYGYSEATTITWRIRRTNISGDILASNVEAGSTNGASHTWETTYVDTAPTDGHYVMTLTQTQQWMNGGTHTTLRTFSLTYSVSTAINLAIGSTNQVLTVSGGLPSWQTSTAIHTTIAGEISGLTEKTTPVNADLIVIEDSAATNAKKKVQFSNLIPLINVDGWVSAGETWTYASADDPTYTFTISGDKTGKYSPGMRIKLTQTTVKYFIITKVALVDTTTTITVYGGTDYDLADAAISLNYYSTQKIPQGFPLSPAKWSVSLSTTETRQQSSPVNGTWYNAGTTNCQLSVPIGVWNLGYKTAAFSYDATGIAYMAIYVTLSTANNSESDTGFTLKASTGATNQYNTCQGSVYKTVEATSKTVYYLNIKTDVDNVDTIGHESVATTITAICAYL